MTFEETRVGGFKVTVTDDHKVRVRTVSPDETITPGTAATLAEVLQEAGLAAVAALKEEAAAKARIAETKGPKYAEQW